MTELWFQAGLIRAKRLPDIKTLIRRESSSKDLEERMRQAFMEHNLKFQRRKA